MTDETQSRVREIHLVDQTLRHLMFAFVGVLIGLAGMMIVNAPARAEALCGGLDERGHCNKAARGGRQNMKANLPRHVRMVSSMILKRAGPAQQVIAGLVMR